MIYRSIFIVAVYLMVIWTSPVYGGTERFEVPLAGSPSLGPADAPVTIIEFLDYQ